MLLRNLPTQSTKMLPIIILTTFLTKSYGHVPKNSSDVVIVGGHADMPDQGVVFMVTTPREKEMEKEATKATDDEETDDEATKKTRRDDDEDYLAQHSSDVVFVTTEGEPWNFRRDQEVHDDSVRMADVLRQEKQNTDPPDDKGVFFVSGRNEQDRERETEQEKLDKKRVENAKHFDFYLEDESTTKKPKKPLDCRNLNCNMTIDSVCGSRVERKKWQYRLFMNECHFRRVNCGMTYEKNRYIQVQLSFCGNAYLHEELKKRQKQFPYGVPYYPQPIVRYEPPPTHERIEPSVARREVSGRRAMSLDPISGWCGHECPIKCTEEQKPVCAVNARKQKKVFLNHCKLDEHSCLYKVTWQTRPLSECVGVKRADIEQNKPFISWMQHMGLVDSKGRLALE